MSLRIVSNLIIMFLNGWRDNTNHNTYTNTKFTCENNLVTNTLW